MPADVTQILLQWSEGDQEALDRLLPLVYDQLKHLAHARLGGERAGHTSFRPRCGKRVEVCLIETVISRPRLNLAGKTQAVAR